MGEAVTEEKVVVVKEAKVAITKTLATLSAKLSVNNKFQRMYSLCGLCVCIYDICFSFGSIKKKEKESKKKKKKKKENHTLPYKHTNSIPVSFTIIRITHKSQSFILFLHPQTSFIPSSLILFNYLLSLKEIMDDLIE